MICHNYPNFGVCGKIWGILPVAANAAPDVSGSPDHVLQEEHLLQSPPPGREVCLQSAFGLLFVLGPRVHKQYRILIWLSPKKKQNTAVMLVIVGVD